VQTTVVTTKGRTAQQTERRRERNRNKRTRQRLNRVTRFGTSSSVMQNVYPLPGGADTGMRKLNKIRLSQGERVTKEGLSFLKCAFAPPDFAANDVGGVPDDFHGPSLVKKHRGVFPQGYGTPSVDVYYMLLPTPGIAFWSTSVTAGAPILATTVWTGILYSDFGTMFGTPATTANIVDKFRFVSNHIEVIPTVNQMQWTGNFQVWKMPVAVVERQAAVAGGETLTVTGIAGANATNAAQYTGPFNLGLYAAAYNTGAKFDFTQITENRTSVPGVAPAAGDFGQLTATAFTGLDNQFDSVLIKVSGTGTNVLNSVVVKTWACVEYQVTPGNLLYEFATLSPVDPCALRIYREVINNLPVGVPFTENADFWNRVLNIIRLVTGSLSVLPGPAGMISGGLHTITSGVQSLMM